MAIATFARPDSLTRSLIGLARQTLVPEEILVSVWKGDAVTLGVLERMRVDLPLIRVLVCDQNTVIAKENAAIREASAEILAFHDDDAIARPDWLLRLASHYEKPDVGAVGGRDVIWLSGHVVERSVRDVGRVRWYGRLVGNHHEVVAAQLDVDFLKGCNMSFRRELLLPIDERIRGIVPYGFEIDLGLAVRRTGHRVVYDPQCLVDHYPTTHYGADVSAMSFTVNHNQTYILLKNLPVRRKLAYLMYTFVLGDRNAVALARIPILVLRSRWTMPMIAAHFAGKLAGALTYARSLR